MTLSRNNNMCTPIVESNEVTCPESSAGEQDVW